MADLNPIAKRIHNVSPDPIRLTLNDGTETIFQISGAEFFQQEFQAEGTRMDEDAEYRFVSSDDNETILVGRKGPEGSGWSTVGSIHDTAPAESE